MFCFVFKSYQRNTFLNSNQPRKHTCVLVCLFLKKEIIKFSMGLDDIAACHIRILDNETEVFKNKTIKWILADMLAVRISFSCASILV